MTGGAITADAARCQRRKANPYAAVAAALMGCFLASYHTRFIGIGLPDLRGAFGLSVDEASWLATIANAPQILTAPAVPWLVMVFGIRPILLWPGLGYAMLLALIPFVRDTATLFALHATTALLLGLFVPATLLVIVRNLAPALWLPAFAIYTFRLAFTLNSGPGLTGYFVQEWGWQWLYWSDVPLALLMAGLAWLGSTPHGPDAQLLDRADWGGMLLFGLGLMLIYIGVDQGNRLDWHNSGTVVATLYGGLTLMGCFFLHERIVRYPWARPGILLNRNTILGISAGAIFSFVAVANSVLVPNFLLSVGQLRPEQFGWFLVVWVAVPLILTSCGGVYLLRRVDFRLVLILGFSSLAAASLWATHLTSSWRMDDFIPVVLLQSVGLGVTLTAVIVCNFTSIRPDAAAAFAAYLQILRLIAVAFGVAVMTTLLRVREQIHSNLIGLHVGRGDAFVTRHLADRASAFVGDDPTLARTRAVASLANTVRREANVLAFIDGFALTFVVALCGVLIVAAMRRAPVGPLTAKP